MAGVAKLFGGGLSSLCVFDQRLGSDEETATIEEQADRILYYFPPHLPLGEQLRHVGMLEGFIAFSRSLSHRRSGCDAVHLNKRRYVFFEAEPDVWIVALIVNQEIAPTPATQFTASTDPVTSEQPHRYDTTTVDDSTLREVIEGVYRVYTTFYGSISRVLRHTNAAAAIERLAGLRADLRRLVHKAAARAANTAHLQAAAHASVDEGGGVADPPATSPAIVGGEPPAQRRFRLLISALEAVSPVAAVRGTLRSAFDFLVYYTDWSHVLPLDGALPLRSHKTPPRVAGTLESTVAALISRVPCLSRGAILVDGQLVAGRIDATLSAVHHFLRLYAFHVLHGTYVPPSPSPAASPARREGSGAAVGASFGVGPTSAAGAPRAVDSASADGTDNASAGTSPAPSQSGPGPTLSNEPQPGERRLESHVWSSDVSVRSVSRWLAALPADDAAPVTTSLSMALLFGDDAGTAKSPGGLGGVRVRLGVSTAGDETTGAVKPVAPPALPGFHRVVKPAVMAAAPLSAASPRSGVYSVSAAAGLSHPLAVPYVSQAYLDSLALLRSPSIPPPEDVSAHEPAVAAAAASAPASPPRPPPVAPVRFSTGCIGPQLPRRQGTAGLVDASPVDALRSQLAPLLRRAAEAVVGSGAAAATSSSPADPGRVFVPAVFAQGPDAAAPSHRLLWAQHGLVTVLCLLDAASLQQATAQTPAHALTDAGPHDESVGDAPVADINPDRLRAAVEALQDVSARTAAVEAAVLGSLDATATAAQGVTGDGMRAVFWQRGPRVVDAYGLRGVARRTRGSASGAQAVPVASGYVAAEVPRHLLVAWNFAKRDALSFAAAEQPGAPAQTERPGSVARPAGGGMDSRALAGGGMDSRAPANAGSAGAPPEDRLPVLLALASDRRAAALTIAGAVRRRAASASAAVPLAPTHALPALRLPSNASVQLATRYDGAVAAVSRERAAHLTFALSFEHTPDPPAWVLARAYEFHRGYYGDPTQALHQRH